MHTGNGKNEGRESKGKGDSPSRIITTADTSHITVIETSATLTDLPRQREELPQIEAAANTHREKARQTHKPQQTVATHSSLLLTPPQTVSIGCSGSKYLWRIEQPGNSRLSSTVCCSFPLLFPRTPRRQRRPAKHSLRSRSAGSKSKEQSEQSECLPS